MREMKQGNVCAFIGAYVHAEHVTLVTEYCTRGEGVAKKCKGGVARQREWLGRGMGSEQEGLRRRGLMAKRKKREGLRRTA